MIALLCVLAGLLVLVCYLLFAPFYLEIDSEKGLLRVRFHHLASARLIGENTTLMIDLRVAGWKKKIDLFSREVPEKKPKAITRTESLNISADQVKAVLQSFKVRRCLLNLDLGNVQWNGLLFPVFFWMSRSTGFSFSINFLDVNEIHLTIENNMARIMRAYYFNKQ